jgi:quercetin dioxygenase-like cupin family protein
VPSYFVVENLLTQVEIPKDRSVSLTLHHDERVKVVLFGLSAGQELSRNSTAVPAILEIVQGNARVTLDSETKELTQASWIFLEANLPHAVYAKTDVVMVRTMLMVGADTQRGPGMGTKPGW